MSILCKRQVTPNNRLVGSHHLRLAHDHQATSSRRCNCSRIVLLGRTRARPYVTVLCLQVVPINIYATQHSECHSGQRLTYTSRRPLLFAQISIAYNWPEYKIKSKKNYEKFASPTRRGVMCCWLLAGVNVVAVIFDGLLESIWLLIFFLLPAVDSVRNNIIHLALALVVVTRCDRLSLSLLALACIQACCTYVRVI